MELQDQIIALRKETKMGRREFAEYFGIPYRTLQDWELGNRKMPGKFCVKKVHIAGLCRE